MNNLPGKSELLDRAVKQRGDCLRDLKAQVDRAVETGGDIGYQEALEAINASARFAAQVASVNNLLNSRPMA